ncbi:phosphoribosylglycinamide formyltransferase, chloroplastic [Olea europaea subsp. europaea]|uniref:phosphoribosylglycinamide formyltransferase 1 n=1 Tax=Olea europaea subsp. europaea TaxID=158383 RepID=A0A8S0UZK3_OLEEU|nr:phosphoribosylglycinamide formyltransferase, chloroplastic [Olea europaea subsp. europaea]
MPFLTHFSTPITGNSSVGSMSIRAQGSILCPSSSSQIQSIQSPKPPCVLTVPTYFSFKIFSTKRGWLKSNSSFSSHCILPASTNLRRRNCVIKTEHKVVSDVEEDNVKSKAKRKNLAVFVSGGGSNFRSIFYATLNGSVHGDIVVLVTNKYDCGGAEYARDKGIPVILFPKNKDATEGLSAEDLIAALRSYKVDFILLAGYLKLIPTELVRAYPKSIVNIHPSLLPAFGGKGYFGMKVHKAVIASGARYSGPTIHYVDEHYDTGRILAQRVVPVLANDTAEELAARVLHEVVEIYIELLYFTLFFSLVGWVSVIESGLPR